MKKILLLLTIIFSVVQGENLSGEALLDIIIKNMNPESAKGIMIQTIFTTSGDKRVLKYETFSNEKGKNSILRYISPSRVRGNALLMKNFSDDIWMYNNRTKRVRKLATHAKKQKFEGSDFTYEDMGAGESWKKDFLPKNVGWKKYKSQNCTILELTAINKKNTYSKILVYCRPDDYYPLKIEYYNREKKLQKILFLQDIEKIDGIPTAMFMIMENQRDKTKTTLAYEKIEYNVKFAKNYFSERSLKNNR